MGYQGNSLRRDTQELARSTGSEAGGCFWGILAGIAVVFWPSIFVHGPHRLTAEIVWYTLVGAITLFVVIAAGTGMQIPDPQGGVPRWVPQPLRPDLREAGEFGGKLK